MSDTSLKCPKLSVDLTDADFKRLKHDISLDSSSHITSPTSTPTSSHQISHDPVISQSASIFVEDNIHSAPSLHDQEYSPLTPIEEISSLLKQAFIRSGTKWCRTEENGWLLPGESAEDLKGAVWPGM